MPLPHRLLQIGTLALFSSMIGGLVVFQSSAFTPERPLMRLDSLPPAGWSDSARMRSALVSVRQSHLSMMSSSKVGLVFDKVYYEAAERATPSEKLLYGDTIFRGYVRPLAMEAFLKDFSHDDTLQALDVLRMRRDISELNLVEALDFQMKCEQTAYQDFHRRMWPSVEDSLQIWRRMNRLRSVSALSAPDQHRFRTILDSLLRPRMMSSKSGLVFPQQTDSTEALKILTAEKRRR